MKQDINTTRKTGCKESVAAHIIHHYNTIRYFRALANITALDKKQKNTKTMIQVSTINENSKYVQAKQ